MYGKWKRFQKNKQKRQKTYFEHVCPAKIQISLRIRAVWSESLLGAFWISKNAIILHVDNEDWSDCMDAQADLILHWVHNICKSLDAQYMQVVTWGKGSKRCGRGRGCNDILEQKNIYIYIFFFLTEVDGEEIA